ncbi:hypothetical protein EHM76_01625 [bacterium]|nr:MAG: hypothetical protein EHM76_01625 [bacterium]
MRTGKFRYVVSNLPDVWSTEISEIKPEEKIYLDSVIILDEAGEFIENEAEAKVLQSFMGKFRCIVLMPSRLKPACDCHLHAYPIFQGNIIGLPFVIFRWAFKYQKINDAGTFIWWGMKEIYGIYDSNTPATSDMGILDWLVDHKLKVQRFLDRKHYYAKDGKTYGILRLDQKESDVEGEDRQTVHESSEGEGVLD